MAPPDSMESAVERAIAAFAAGEPVQFWLFTIDMMAIRTQILVPTFAEANEDFVAPDPDPMVGRPAPEASLFRVDLHMLHIIRPQLCNRGRRTTTNAQQQDNPTHHHFPSNTLQTKYFRAEHSRQRNQPK